LLNNVLGLNTVKYSAFTSNNRATQEHNSRVYYLKGIITEEMFDGQSEMKLVHKPFRVSFLVIIITKIIIIKIIITTIIIITLGKVAPVLN
jgi:hypothetical protein